MIANNKGADQTARKTSAFIVLRDFSHRGPCDVEAQSSLLLPCCARLYLEINTGPPGVWGSWGEGLYIFMELGCTGNHFRDLRSKLIFLGILGALQKSKN